MKISVLTPTYNRVDLLKKLYNSLLRNANYGVDIEWIIMDDGSTDNTKELINKFIFENQIEIQYYFQENKGKMIAINNLVDKATGELIVECDSDDYFVSNAFKTIKEEWEKNNIEKECYAMCFLKYNQNKENMGNLFKYKKTTMFDLYFKEGETGEKALVFFSDVRKKYKHELVNNERFITEARMYHKMDLDYKILCINKPIMICEYQQDGYSKNINKEFKENPYGYYEYFKEILAMNFKGVKFRKRIYAIKHYILFSYLTKQYHSRSIRNIENKILYYVFLLPGVIKSRAKNKNRK